MVTAAASARVFEAVVERMRPIEGGFSNDPDDPGGPTNYGISLRFALGVGDLDGDGRPDLDIDGDGDVDIDDIRAMDWPRAVSLYREYFWRRMHCPALPGPVAAMMFDTAVNMGRGPAVVMLQACLGVAQDGRPGPVTIRAAWTWEPADLVLAYGALRVKRYWTLPGFGRFGKGWVLRTLALHHFCVVDIQGKET